MCLQEWDRTQAHSIEPMKWSSRLLLPSTALRLELWFRLIITLINLPMNKVLLRMENKKLSLSLAPLLRSPLLSPRHSSITSRFKFMERVSMGSTKSTQAQSKTSLKKRHTNSRTIWVCLKWKKNLKSLRTSYEEKYLKCSLYTLQIIDHMRQVCSSLRRLLSHA